MTKAYMDIISGKSLKEVESLTCYEGCTFYLSEDDQVNVEHCHFDNCSFRGVVKLHWSETLSFNSCGFSSMFSVTVCNEKQLCHLLDQAAIFLAAVTELDASQFELTDLSKRMGHLTALKKLSVSYSEYSTVPDEIGKLSALEELCLSYSRLSYSTTEYDGLTIEILSDSIKHDASESLRDEITQVLSNTRVRFLMDA